MNPTSASFDQPTQEGHKGGKKLTPKQKASIFAGFGGVATLATIGSALAWGMSQDGSPNENHPAATTNVPKVAPANENKVSSQTEAATSKPENNKPSNETPADSANAKPRPDVTPDVKPHPEATPDVKAAHPDTQDESEVKAETDNTDNEPTLSTKVTDDMSLEDAFKAARDEVGAGGFFEWHGHYYNTFYKEEWEKMSEQKQQEYIDQVYDKDYDASKDFTTPSDATTNQSTGNNESTEAKPDVRVGQYEGHSVGLGDTDHDGDAEVIVIDDGTVGAVDTDNDGVMDTRVELDPETHQVTASSPLASTFDAPSMNVFDERGTNGEQNQTDQAQVANNTGSTDEPVVVLAEVGDHEVIMEDVDQDGYVDVMVADNGVVLIDTDGDHQFDAGMVVDTQTGDIAKAGYLDHDVSVPHFESADTHDTTDYAQDYDNNADVSDWAA